MSFMVARFFKRTVLAIVLGGSCLWGIKTAYFALTDGFSVSNISSAHPDDPLLAIAPLANADATAVDNALSQEFTYLAKGNHSYVFESADKQYVIKFLQFQKYRHHPLINCLPLPAALDEKRQNKTLHKEEKRDALLMSWKVAFTRLKEQTQLLYVHLNRADPVGKTLIVHNKCGLTYRLDLDRYVFMLQKKVDLFPEVLEDLVSKGDMTSAKQLLDGLLDLYLFEYQQGLFEEDRYIVRNTGVFDHRPMHLDVDRFREDDTLKLPEQQALQLQWKTALLLKWLEKLHPDLAQHLKERLIHKKEEN